MAKKKKRVIAKTTKKAATKPTKKAVAKTTKKTEAKPRSKPTVPSNNHKAQIETIFASWVIKKWGNAKHGNSFILEIKEVVGKSSMSHKDANVYLFNAPKNVVEIAADQLNNWANGQRPTIILCAKEEQLSYLLLEEHFLNTLFSENPSRTANNEISISLTQFTNLTKTKLKSIQEFVFRWKKMSFSVLESGTYFKYKDALKQEVSKTILDLENLKVDLNLDALREIDEDINRAIYTVAIVGATKAGKSTIINSLISKYVSPVDIRPTTGIPTNIVPGKEEKAEVLLQDDQIIPGPANESFLNQYVAIDQNRSNYKKVKMVTVWVKSATMEKGLSFCDFPGLDDADPVIEKTVVNSLKFVNAIIYVIDASSMTSGFKFPRQYRDDLLNLKNKDKIFLVFNKMDYFTDPELVNKFKAFIDEQLELLGLQSLFSYPPIYMTAKRSFEQRMQGVHTKDEMALLESQVWDHLLANSKSGLHNLMNIVGQLGQESERLSRMLSMRVASGDEQKRLRSELQTTEQELNKIKVFEKQKREEMKRWLDGVLTNEKEYLIQYYTRHLKGIGLNNTLPDNHQIQNYLTEQFTLTAPELFGQLEDKLTQLHNDLNTWVNNKLQPVEISIDKYTKHQFRNSETFFQLLQPISHIFSESYGKQVPTSLLGNIFYHLTNTLEGFGDFLWEIFTNAQTVRDKKIGSIIKKLRSCYDETFDKIYYAFNAHLEHKCSLLLNKVIDRSKVYISGMNKQISELNNPLTPSEKQLYAMAFEKLVDLDNECSAIKLQIEENTATFKPKPESTKESLDADVDLIEKQLRILKNDILVSKLGTTEAKRIVLPHLQPKIEERISKLLRDHPGTPASKYETFESQLPFFDMSEYFDMIANANYWPHFKDTFNNKENLSKHIVQLSNLRNTIRHGRELTDLILAEGQASIVWFKMALKIPVSAN